MQGLFYYCENLESIDLSSFDTSKVTHIGWMFFHCYKIKYIIIPETFKTSKVVSMKSMFSHCQSLISLNLSSFDTTQVTEMCFMFKNCTKLKYLDIQHFSPLNITDIEEMFYHLYSLIFLNIYSFEIGAYTKYTLNSFENFNAKICSNENNMKNYLSRKNINNDCSDICFKNNI